MTPAADTTPNLWYTPADAVNAAEVLRQYAQGHDETARVIADRTGVDGLTVDQLRHLCGLFLVDV